MADAALSSSHDERLTVAPRMVERAGYVWCVLPDAAELVDGDGVDFAALVEGPGIRRIKRNGQRDVWRLDVRCGSYFLKRYRNESLASRLKTALRGPVAELEWSAGHYAARHGIAAVRPVAYAWRGTHRWSARSLLVTRAVPGAMPLCDYWLSVRDQPTRAGAMTRGVARLVARAHQCGFHHLDMHAGNIIVQTEGAGAPRPMFVDLHNARIGASVRPRAIVANLAQLNQWFRRHATRAQRLRFLKAYLVARDEFAQASPFARNWHIEPRTLLATLALAARRHAERLWAKRDRRSMRSGRYFARIQLRNGWTGHAALVTKHPRAGSRVSHLVCEPAQWAEWLAAPESWVAPQNTTVLKDSHSARVCRATLPTDPPLPIIAKRPIPRSLFKRLLYWIGPSRNRRAWRRANMLLHRDLPAAQPLALVERRTLGLWRRDSILLTEFVENAVDLEAFLVRELPRQPSDVQRRMKDRLIGAVVSLVVDLAERGFAHRDFKAPNILVRWDSPYTGPAELVLIDMDGVSHRGGVQRAAARRALVRLSVSLADVGLVTRTDRARALRGFLIHSGQARAEWTREWGAWQAESDAKADEKDARRDWKLARYGRA
ncbi:MAG: lipopolysaccharide kinase InaA family protein [Phycisphaerae bacterium]